MRVITMVAVASVCAGAGAYDWSQHSASAGGSVSLPEGTYEVTDGDMETVNSLAGINLAASNSVIVFNLAEDHDLSCSVTNLGQIVKRGAGALTCLWPAVPLNLPWIGKMANWFTEGGMRVEAGTFKLPQDAQDGCKLGDLFVAEGATFFTPMTSAFGRSDLQLVSLHGAGTVTNAAKADNLLSIGGLNSRAPEQYHKPSEFSGVIAGKKLRYYSGGYVMLTGTNSVNANDFAVHSLGTTGLMKIGEKAGEPSSMGYVGTLIFRENGSTYLYLGKGERTEKQFSVWYSPAVFDAGAFGGVTFAGAWSTLYDSSRTAEAKYVVLGGSNSAPCVVESQIKPYVYNSEPNGNLSVISLVKRGTGTWRLASAGANRDGLGLVAVEEGTLQYDDVAETNDLCSFGTNPKRYARGYSGSTPSMIVSHDVELAAAAGKSATLEHVGEEWTGTSSRAIGLSGDGRLEANSVSGAVAWLAGAYPLDGKTRTLYLGGTNQFASWLGNASDGANGGRLDLVKDGTGTWRLERNQTQSGTIDVRNGTLEAGNSVGSYTWFRFVVKALVGPNTCVSGNEFAMYDADGERLDLGLELVPALSSLPANDGYSYYHPSLLAPGQVTCGETGTMHYYKEIRYINNLFDGKSSEVFFYNASNSRTIKMDDPATWFKMFVLRLPAAAKKAVSYDFASYYGWDSLQGVRTVKAWRLDGSKDGIFWSTLDERSFETNDVPCRLVAGKWYSDGTSITAAGARKLSDGKGFGFELAPPEEGSYTMFANLSGVKVAPGATFKRVGTESVSLPALTVDCYAGNGTIDGFDFAESGTIDVVGVANPDMPSHPAITLANLPDGALERVNDRSKWSLTWNGEPSARFRVKVSATKVDVYPHGTVILVR